MRMIEGQSGRVPSQPAQVVDGADLAKGVDDLQQGFALPIVMIKPGDPRCKESPAVVASSVGEFDIRG